MTDAQVSIFEGDKELISSGSFQTFGEAETQLRLTWHNETITFYFRFTNGPEQTQIAEVVDNTTLRLTFNKYDNPLGIHPLQPIRVGTIADRELWFMYTIRYVQQTTRHIVEYSFYVSPEVPRG